MNSKGKLAELKAVMLLQDKKYKLDEVNYTCRFGEIDIIAENKKHIVFAEVKMRESNSFAKPREYVDEIKQQKMIASAKLYLASHPTKLQPRFDVIEVVCDDYKIISIKHLENAFQLV